MSAIPVKSSYTEPLSNVPLHRQICQQLQEHYQMLRDLHMRDMFAEDPLRFERFSLETGDLMLDYSKNRITGETMQLLVKLAEEADIAGWRERMFSGEKINNTENRAVLHVALRNRSNRPVWVDGVDVMPDVHAVIDKMAAFSGQVRDGIWLGYSGKRITDIVNIGIGGSDLGPQMVYQALKPGDRRHVPRPAGVRGRRGDQPTAGSRRLPVSAPGRSLGGILRHDLRRDPHPDAGPGQGDHHGNLAQGREP